MSFIHHTISRTEKSQIPLQLNSSIQQKHYPDKLRCILQDSDISGMSNRFSRDQIQILSCGKAK